jgi:hypothetical protein
LHPLGQHLSSPLQHPSLLLQQVSSFLQQRVGLYSQHSSPPVHPQLTHARVVVFQKAVVTEPQYVQTPFLYFHVVLFYIAKGKIILKNELANLPVELHPPLPLGGLQLFFLI